jgi:thiamine-phosphate pyrophosphorylase
MHNFIKTKYYFINKFDINILGKIDKQTIIIYRNYSFKNNEVDKILKIKDFCKKKKIKFYLSNNITLALKLNLDGAYIPSFNKNLKHLSFSFKKNFELIGSAHNLRQIRVKENQLLKKYFYPLCLRKIKII